MSFNGWWLEPSSKSVSVIAVDSGYFYLQFAVGGLTSPDFTKYKITKEDDLWFGAIKIVDKELTEWT